MTDLNVSTVQDNGPSVSQAKPKSHLVWAILSCLFFLPFAVAAVVYAAKVNGLWASGDIAGAQRASKRALLFAAGAVTVSIIVIIMMISGAFGSAPQ